MASTGWAVLHHDAVARLAGVAPAQWGLTETWPPLWEHLPPDTHLRDGGRYRRRQHGCFVLEGGQLHAVPHRAHWQPVAYNALHGGIERWFEPLASSLTADRHWALLMGALGRAADMLQPGGVPIEAPGQGTWFIEAHAFRIDTTDGIGRPTPEGAHRDGVDLVAVLLLARHNVKGGETRVFDARGPQGVRFTLAQPGSALLLDDARVIHETTPIQPLEPHEPAWRDTLVVTLRRGGFQGPTAA
jgi:hypothetical protein